VRRVAVGSDHTGIVLRRAVRDHLRGQGLAVQEVGPDTPDAVDYPDTAGAVARLVALGEVDGGIVVDGAGLGSAIAANKVRGVRAALCNELYTARMARAHNDANVLSIGARVVGEGLADEIVATFLSTPFDGGRHARRVAQLAELEEHF
jgi:ribose 5-phosphate isomerase B